MEGVINYTPFSANGSAEDERTTDKKVSDAAKWVFIGFLPTWVCLPQREAFLSGSFQNKIFNIVPVIRNNTSGEPVYNGCVHAMTENVDELIGLFDRRLVIDRNGYWYAETESQIQDLKKHFNKRDKFYENGTNMRLSSEVSLKPVVVGLAFDQEQLFEDWNKKLVLDEKDKS